MSDGWTVDPDKFVEPALKGDIAMLALYVDTVASSLTKIAEAHSLPENSRQSYFGSISKDLMRLRKALDDMQRALVGVEGPDAGAGN